MVTVWPRTAAELPGAAQVKLNGVARPAAGVTSTMPGRAVWFGMIQWSTALKATGWPDTTPLTVTLTGKIAVKFVVSALIGAKLDGADTAVVVQRVDWQFTGEVPPPVSDRATASATVGTTAPSTTTSPPRTSHRRMTAPPHWSTKRSAPPEA